VLTRDGLGGQTQWRYDARDQPVERVDPDGARWSHAFDGRGRLRMDRDPLGNETRYEYDARGNLTLAVDPAGRSQRFVYDLAGNLAMLFDGEGRRAVYAHDELGNLVAVTDVAGAETRMERDLRGLLRAVTRPDGTRVLLEYDGERNVTRLTDGAGRVTRLRYAGRGKLVEREDPAGQRVRYAYDTEENLIAVENEAGERYEMECDLLGRVVRERSFDGALRRWRFDRAGRCVEAVNASEQIVRHAYDPLGRLVQRSAPGLAPERFEYDAVGRMVLAANADAELRWDLDGAGRLLREHLGEHVVESALDPGGARLLRTTDLGARTAYQWDQASELVRTTAYRAGAPDLCVEIARDARGDESARRFPGEAVLSVARDVRGRVTEHDLAHGAAELLRETFRWGAEDGPTLRVNPTTGPTRYERDPRGALTAAVSAEGAAQWRAQDAVGNLFRSPDGSDRRYGPGGVILEDRGVRFEHDADGRLVQRIETDGSRWRYQWDALGRLRGVHRPDGQRVAFGYDPLGRRVHKSVDGARTEYVWDGDDIVHVLHAHGATEAWVTMPGGFAPLGHIVDGRWRSIVTDELGAPLACLEEDGAPVWRGALDVFGVPTPTAPDALPWRWPGQIADPETGLYYNRFRYYDPSLGRYISPDPLGLFGGLSAYGYVRDPLVWVDPYGWIAGPASLPDEPGIYILTNGNQSYVGSAGIGAQGMNTRISSTRHSNAQMLLGMPGTTVQYVRVDLGAATSASDRNNILCYYEAREFNKQAKKSGITMLNSAGIQSAAKAKHAANLISTHNSSASSRRTTCK
jgi:RHS repeat-associated protein